MRLIFIRDVIIYQILMKFSKNCLFLAFFLSAPLLAMNSQQEQDQRNQYPGYSYLYGSPYMRSQYPKYSGYPHWSQYSRPPNFMNEYYKQAFISAQINKKYGLKDAPSKKPVQSNKENLKPENEAEIFIPLFQEIQNCQMRKGLYGLLDEMTNLLHGKVKNNVNISRAWYDTAKKYRNMFKRKEIDDRFLTSESFTKFQKAWSQQADLEKRTFKPSELINILYGYALFRIEIPQAFYGKLLTQILLNAHQLGAQELSNFFYGHALLNKKMDEGSYKMWVKRTLEISGELEAQHVSNIFYGHALLEERIDVNSPLYKALVAQCLKLIERDKTDRSQRRINIQVLSNILRAHTLLKMKMDFVLYQQFLKKTRSKRENKSLQTSLGDDLKYQENLG